MKNNVVIKTIKDFSYYYTVKINAILLRLRLEQSKSKLKSHDCIDEDRKEKVIISLTSYPERICGVHLTLYSLLLQSFKPDLVVLWLAEEQFPLKEKGLPKKLLFLKRYGLSIQWCKNLGSYKKLIPSLIKYPNSVIVTADDDVYYEQDWLQKLFSSYKKDPRSIHCHRAFRIEFDKEGNIIPYDSWKVVQPNSGPSLLNLQTGMGGVLYPPYSLNRLVLEEDIFKKVASTGDDIWFWAMAVKNKTRINLVANNVADVVDTFPERLHFENGGSALFKLNCHQKMNDIMLCNVFKEFNLYDELRQEKCL